MPSSRNDNQDHSGNLNAAEMATEDSQPIELSRKDFEAILSLIENPPPPNVALLKAAKLHEKMLTK